VIGHDLAFAASGWVVIVAAEAAGLAVGVIVAETGQEVAPTGVIAGFCEPAALVPGVTVWAADRQASPLVQEAEKAHPAMGTGSGSESAVADRCRQNDNVQHVTFRDSALGS
jgi:hypothetical protein